MNNAQHQASSVSNPYSTDVFYHMTSCTHTQPNHIGCMPSSQNSSRNPFAVHR
jgi:hypothetical protein